MSQPATQLRSETVEPVAEAPPVAPARFYQPELDGLRFVAFLAVYISHAVSDTNRAWIQLGLPGETAIIGASAIRSGAFGLDLFFCLSAFLITELLLREREKLGQLRTGPFLARRALRIWPLYFLMLFASFGIDAGVHRIGLSLGAFAAFALLAGNWYSAIIGFPDSVTAPMWSLSIEEQFYVLWPLALRFIKTSALGIVALGLWLFSLGARITLFETGFHWVYQWCSTPVRLDSIAMGIALAWWLRRRGPISLPSWARVCLFVIGPIWWVTREYFWPVREITFAGLFSYQFTSLSVGLMLIAVLGSKGPLSRPVFVYLGRISFGLYIFQMTAIQIVIALGAGPILRPFAALPLTILFASLSYRFYEVRFLKLKSKFTVIQSGATLQGPKAIP